MLEFLSYNSNSIDKGDNNLYVSFVALAFFGNFCKCPLVILNS